MISWDESNAAEVAVVGSFTDWRAIPLKRFLSTWRLDDALLPQSTGTHLYYFVVDGVRKVNAALPHVTVDSGDEYNTYQNRHPRADNTDVDVPTASKIKKTLSYMTISKRVFLNQFMIPGVSDGTQDTTRLLNKRKLLIVMVGLPARGKSYTSRKLCRYLNWMGYICKMFNFGQYRRACMTGFQNHDFFSNENAEGARLREKFAVMAMNDALKFLNEGGGIAILDGTNSNVNRRQSIMDFFKTNKTFSLKTLFLEIICNDQTIIRKNVLASKTLSPDYVGVGEEQILDDFMKRVRHYERTYEPLGTDGEDKSYIKIIDIGRQIVTNRVQGFLLCRILFYLTNLHAIPRPIFLCRHGQSEYNVNGRLGGDSPLNEQGIAFAEKLAQFCKKELQVGNLAVWTSTMRRAIETAAPLVQGDCAQFVKWKALDEIDVGVCDGMTYKEIETNMPDDFSARQKDKLRYRYPRGESYEDLIRRVEPVIMELERSTRPVLIIGHQAVMRCLLAYLCETSLEELPHTDVPIHTVLKITPHAYGTHIEKFAI